MEDKFYVKISPECLSTDVAQKIFDGITFGVYSGMTEFLSGNTVDFNIPIILTQEYDDMGFYTPFDGYFLQKDIVKNFIFDGDEDNLYMVKIYNTSEKLKEFLKFSSYQIDWGDGVTETFNETFPNFKSHTYSPEESSYTITMTQNNPWGQTKIQKIVHTPTSNVVINPPQSSLTLPNGVELNYDYVFNGDSQNTILEQISENFTETPFTITGHSESQLHELIQYGSNKYQAGKMVKKYNEDYGMVDEITESYTAYTVNGVQYYDYIDGTTLFFVESYGLTEEMLDELPITKEEVLMGIVSSPEIQSGIFIERGKTAAFEALQRLGEVDNIGDLTSYGYGFFKINKI